MRRPALVKTSDIALLDAIETLTQISEMGFEGRALPEWLSTTTTPQLPILEGTVEWLQSKNTENVMKVVREDFRIILDYLRKFDKMGEGLLINPQTLEGMKAIMLVVSDAAETLDKYSQVRIHKGRGLFWKSIKETKEFKDLMHFYNRKIAPLARREAQVQLVANLPIGQLLQAAIGKASQGSLAIEHHIIDLESLRKDQEYELLYLRRDDGSRFFGSKLVRTLKLICNFEEEPQGLKQGEVFRDISIWNDAQLRLMVKTWVGQVFPQCDQFFKARGSARDHELVQKASNMTFALMLAHTQSRIVPLTPVKGVKEYLHDFHTFLGEITSSSDFGRLIAYPPKNPRAWDFAIYRLVHEIAWSIFTQGRISKDLFNLHEALISQCHEFTYDWDIKSGTGVSSHFWEQYQKLHAVSKEFATQPLLRDVEFLDSDRPCVYDPMLLLNYPFKVYDLSWKNSTIPVYRLPFPTHQEFIDKASISNEFKAFLRESRSRGYGPVLVVDLQNPTSWKEGARSHALHELSHSHEFNGTLIPLTLNRDGDFYRQVEIESGDMTSIDVFFKKLKDAIGSATHGYIYPDKWKTTDFAHFIDLLLETIQEGFLFHKSELSRVEKMEVIDIVQLFVVLKAIDDFAPSFIYITCKDGLDITLPFVTEFYVLLKMLNNRSISHAEEQYLSTVLYGPPLLVRGRPIFQERFNRLISVIRFLERWKNEGGEEAYKGLHNNLHLLMPTDCYLASANAPVQISIKELEK